MGMIRRRQCLTLEPGAVEGVHQTRSSASQLAIDLTAEERRELEGLARRARIVLLAADGLENKEICAELAVDANTDGKWRRRYAERRLDALMDEPRPGAPRQIGDEEMPRRSG